MRTALGPPRVHGHSSPSASWLPLDRRVFLNQYLNRGAAPPFPRGESRSCSTQHAKPSLASFVPRLVTGGNPGGYISTTDQDNGDFTFSAPARFLGNLSGATGLSYDLIYPVGAINYQPTDVILMGNGETLLWKSSPDLVPGPAWMSVSLDFVPSTEWHVGTSNSRNCPSSIRVDLITSKPNPEPTSGPRPVAPRGRSPVSPCLDADTRTHGVPTARRRPGPFPRRGAVSMVRRFFVLLGMILILAGQPVRRRWRRGKKQGRDAGGDARSRPRPHLRLREAIRSPRPTVPRCRARSKSRTRSQAHR